MARRAKGALETDVSPYYIPSSVAIAGQRPHVLTRGKSFAVLDRYGDMQAYATAAEGLFFNDTRHLARLALTIDGLRLLLLSSTVTENNAMVSVDLTNPDLVEDGHLRVGRETLHILRNVTLEDGALLERIELLNFGAASVECSLALDFAVDFVDLFEVRGTAREARGEMLGEQRTESSITLRYRGLDEIERRTILAFDPRPSHLVPGRAIWDLYLASHERCAIEVTIRCETSHVAMPRVGFDAVLSRAAARIAASKARCASLDSSNDAFNEWTSRSRADLDMLINDTPHGLYAFAGIPWFATAFGRDGIITALECLWLDPELAAGTLRYLAANQATALDPATDAEPGKILHETRGGEMAALGEVPFAQYYGSIDATPLFIMLAAAYHARTGDIALIRSLWPHIEAAIAWMRNYGDRDGDGFLEYDRQSPNGLVNQGWRDSGDSVFHADGTLATAPIALAEVQAYAYGAYCGAAELATALGETRRAAMLSRAAETLKDGFERAFWLEELGSYALALDGAKRPCRVRASSSGQTLLSGLAGTERAERVAANLMAPPFYAHWGIRTVAEGESRYNPISYHNGSIWPHDNGLIAMGFARYGLRDHLLHLLTGMFDAATFLELRRLPELFCGFARRPGTGPTSYPVACVPQAWSSATVFAMVGAALGISFDAPSRQIRFARPVLPSWLDELTIANLRLGDASVDLLLQRSHEDVALRVLSCRGELEIVLTA